MTRKISLSKHGYKYRGMYSAIVDDDDYDRINAYAWSYALINGVSYAITTLPILNGKKRQILMHHMVLQVEGKVEIDHADGNGLNNTKSNLRECTRVQNLANSGSRNGKRYKGVYKLPSGTFRVTIKHNGTSYYLGVFLDEEEAAKAYNTKASELNGEFARLNILPDDSVKPHPVTRHRYRWQKWVKP